MKVQTLENGCKNFLDNNDVDLDLEGVEVLITGGQYRISM